MGGDPDLYISFDQPLPTGANYTFMQEKVGVDVFEIGRHNKLFCGELGPAAECKLYLSILGYESTSFSLIVYGVDKSYFDKNSTMSQKAVLLCNPGCEGRSIGDGECNPQCNTSSCFWDRQDCLASNTGCKADCHPDWIGDGYCDEACFNAKCKWDRRDCLDKKQKPCADDCMPSLLADGECDAACNIESCEFDQGDCFHEHDECFNREDGADYRGRVSTTKSGIQCQGWFEQFPHQHVKTHAKYPRSGLGGHSFCRNPDGENSPWCYTVDESLRWDYCDVGTRSETPCLSPPPPSPSPPAPQSPPPPPPSPAPKSPPPAPCPEECVDLRGNGKCDLICNTTTCLWDAGECRDILKAVLAKAKLMTLDKATVGEIVANQGGFMKQAMYGGILLGLVGGLCTACVLCYLRRKKRRLQLTNRKYTPYGEEEDGGGAGIAPVGPDSADVIDPDEK